MTKPKVCEWKKNKANPYEFYSTSCGEWFLSVSRSTKCYHCKRKIKVVKDEKF